MSDEQITIPKMTAQILFDAVVGTLDFGSGMFDTEEVEALRGLAVALGVDPITATPEHFVKHYPHPFKPMTDESTVADLFDAELLVWSDAKHCWTFPPDPARMPDFVPCLAGAYPHCQKPEIDPIHPARETAEMGA